MANDDPLNKTTDKHPISGDSLVSDQALLFDRIHAGQKKLLEDLLQIRQDQVKNLLFEELHCLIYLKVHVQEDGVTVFDVI